MSSRTSLEGASLHEVVEAWAGRLRPNPFRRPLFGSRSGPVPFDRKALAHAREVLVARIIGMMDLTIVASRATCPYALVRTGPLVAFLVLHDPQHPRLRKHAQARDRRQQFAKAYGKVLVAALELVLEVAVEHLQRWDTAEDRSHHREEVPETTLARLEAFSARVRSVQASEHRDIPVHQEQVVPKLRIQSVQEHQSSWITFGNCHFRLRDEIVVAEDLLVSLQCLPVREIRAEHGALHHGAGIPCWCGILAARVERTPGLHRTFLPRPRGHLQVQTKRVRRLHIDRGFDLEMATVVQFRHQCFDLVEEGLVVDDVADNQVVVAECCELLPEVLPQRRDEDSHGLQDRVGRPLLPVGEPMDQEPTNFAVGDAERRRRKCGRGGHDRGGELGDFADPSSSGPAHGGELGLCGCFPSHPFFAPFFVFGFWREGSRPKSGSVRICGRSRMRPPVYSGKLVTIR
eukprot:scaffold3370_cov134-Pinguiococcus_pyrenoidosus.AAC.2